MKNKRKTCFTLFLAASVCLSAATSVYAGTGHMDVYDFFEESSENPCYIIDFMDYDGSLLDSRICVYGEKLTDIINPKPREDEEYIYQFAGWEPQVSETVSGCAAYMATYQKIRKDGAKEPDCTPEPVIREQPTLPNRASSDPNSSGLAPEEITQVSSTSYDVTRFTLETPTPTPEEPASIDAPVSEEPAPQPETVQKEKILEEIAPEESESPQTDTNSASPAASSALEPQNMEISPQIQETSDINVHTPDSASQDLKNNFSQFSASAAATLQDRPADAPTTVKPKRPANAAPTQNTKVVSKHTQLPKSRPSISASTASKSALSETRQSYKIDFAVPALFMGIAILSGAARIREHQKRTRH